MKSPRYLLAFGLSLMSIGVILPYLMILRVLPSTFLLNFGSWGASVIGLALGMIGVADHGRSSRK
jgi:hypothetical protein